MRTQSLKLASLWPKQNEKTVSKASCHWIHVEPSLQPWREINFCLQNSKPGSTVTGSRGRLPYKLFTLNDRAVARSPWEPKMKQLTNICWYLLTPPSTSDLVLVLFIPVAVKRLHAVDLHAVAWGESPLALVTLVEVTRVVVVFFIKRLPTLSGCIKTLTVLIR